MDVNAHHRYTHAHAYSTMKRWAKTFSLAEYSRGSIYAPPGRACVLSLPLVFFECIGTHGLSLGKRSVQYTQVQCHGCFHSSWNVFFRLISHTYEVRLRCCLHCVCESVCVCVCVISKSHSGIDGYLFRIFFFFLFFFLSFSLSLSFSFRSLFFVNTLKKFHGAHVTFWFVFHGKPATTAAAAATFPACTSRYYADLCRHSWERQHSVYHHNSQ